MTEKTFRPQQRSIHEVFITADEQCVITAGEYGSLDFASLSDGRIIKTLHGVSCAGMGSGTTLYYGDSAACVGVLNLDSGKTIREWPVGGKGIRSLAVNQQETVFAVLCLDGNVRICDIEKGKQAQVLTQIKYDRCDLALSSDGSLLAFPGADESSIHIWSLRPPKQLRTLLAKKATVTRLRFLGRTHTLVTGGTVGPIGLWDPTAEVQLSTLERRPGGVTALSSTDDGTLLATGDASGWLSVWDMTTKKVLASVRAHTAAITGLAFSRDGKRLVTTCTDIGVDDKPGHREVKIWSVKPKK